MTEVLTISKIGAGGDGVTAEAPSAVAVLVVVRLDATCLIPSMQTP